MKIGEVSNNTSYQGQGSQVVSAPSSKVSVNKEPAKAPKEEINVNDMSSIIDAKAEEKDNNVPSMTSALKEAVSKINATSSNCEVVYGIHEKTNRVTIKMVDKDTRKTIREFPAEETLDLIAKAWELAGIMVDEKR